MIRSSTQIKESNVCQTCLLQKPCHTLLILDKSRFMATAQTNENSHSAVVQSFSCILV